MQRAHGSAERGDPIARGCQKCRVKRAGVWQPTCIEPGRAILIERAGGGVLLEQPCWRAAAEQILVQWAGMQQHLQAKPTA